VPQERQGSTEPAVEEIRPPARESPLEGCWVLGASWRRTRCGGLRLASWRQTWVATGEHRLASCWRLASTGCRTRVRRTPLALAPGDWRGGWRAAAGERRLASGGCRLAKWRPARATGDRRSGGWRWAGGEPRVFGCRPLGAGGWWPGGRGRLRALLSTACAVASRRSI
jgi:hypothetical protein